MSRPLKKDGNIKVKKMSRTEAITADMLVELCKNPSFESYLVNVVVDSLRNEADNDALTCSKTKRRVIDKDAELKRYSQDALSLQLLLSSVTQTFLRSFDLALCTFDTDRNRDGAFIYSASVIVRDFTSSGSITLDRFKVIVRRMSSLLSVFARRISTPFHIANTTFFANAIYELLHEFESYCTSKLGPLQYFDSLRSSTHDFYAVVVKRLNEIAHLRRRSCDANNREVSRVPCPDLSVFRRSKSASSFSDRLQQYRNLNPSAVKERNINHKVMDRHRRGAGSRCRLLHGGFYKVAANRHLQESTSRTNIDLIEKNNYSVDQLKLNARRLAKEITEEVVEDLAQRVERACSARRKSSFGSLILKVDD